MASGENPLKQIAARELEDWLKAMFDWRAKDFVVTADVQSMHHDEFGGGAVIHYLRVNVVLRAAPKEEVPAVERETVTPTPEAPDPLLPNPDDKKPTVVLEDLEF